MQAKVKHFLCAVLSDERKKQQAMDSRAKRAMLSQGYESNGSSNSLDTATAGQLSLSDMDTRTAKMNGN